MGWVAPDDKKTQHKNLGTEYNTRLDRKCLQRFVQFKHGSHAKKGFPTNASLVSGREEAPIGKTN